MVHLRTVTTTFHARVIAARLGAEGITTQLRGNVGDPFPLGVVSVWVSEEDAGPASELLLADEVEAVFTPHPDDEEPIASRRPRLLGLNRRQLLAVALLILIVWAGLLSRLIL